MFTTELKFSAECLISWFNKKTKSKNLEMELREKIDYERSHSVDLVNDKCCICKFPLQINAKGIQATAKEMSYVDFYIRKEYKFLRNVLPEEELKALKTLKSLAECYEVFLKKC